MIQFHDPNPYPKIYISKEPTLWCEDWGQKPVTTKCMYFPQNILFHCIHKDVQFFPQFTEPKQGRRHFFNIK